MRVVQYINGDQPGVVLQISNDELHTLSTCCSEASILKKHYSLKKRRLFLAYANVLDQLFLKVGWPDRQESSWSADEFIEQDLARIKANGFR